MATPVEGTLVELVVVVLVVAAIAATVAKNVDDAILPWCTTMK
jgi:hypothetical protein